MSLDPIVIDTAPHPVACIVLMHGLGADGSDFVPIAEQLDLSAVGPVRYVFPNAPLMPVTLNGGHVMPAWYDIYGGLERGRREDEAGLRRSQAAIEALLAQQAARGIPARRTVLAGFSQGCAMALLTGLRHPERLAGIAGLSGYLPLAAHTAAERHPANADVPIFLAHGAHDPVVLPERAEAAHETLADLGHTVEWHSYPMEHTVCLPELDDLQRWLQRVLAA